MEKYLGKYRIPSNRHQDYDYSAPGAYFVTICTKNKEHYFGRIADGRMEMARIGIVAFDFWCDIPNHFPFVSLEEFVIMPNHIHGILIFNETAVETQNLASLRVTTLNQGINKFGPQSKNLASVIRGFKTAVKSYATSNNIEFFWQPRYYDHIIRDESDYNRIKIYVAENPGNWENDEYCQRDAKSCVSTLPSPTSHDSNPLLPSAFFHG